MGDVQTDKESAPGKWGLIAASILCAVLLIASIWSLSRVLNKSSPHGSVALTNEAVTVNAVSTQEEIERQDELAEEQPPQVPVVVQPAVSPALQNNDAIKLQKVKAKVNQRIAKRLKQYIRDNPDRDNRELEEQIKRRENQGVQSR